MFIPSAYAQSAGAAGSGTGGIIGLVIQFVLLGAVFWFLLIRPQQKRMKEHRAKIDSVRRGDKVVTGGGIVGTVAKVEGDEATVEIAEGVRVRVMKGTITDVLSKAEPADGEKSEPAEKPKAEGGLLGRLTNKK